ncbi:UNVERIFIED_CONTAM: hypothetical protein ABIE34_000616 [Jeotgalibacillus campisalis]
MRAEEKSAGTTHRVTTPRTSRSKALTSAIRLAASLRGTLLKRRQSVVLACALAGTLGLSGALALPVLAETPPAGSEPKFSVENYNHPEAARLEAERGIKLKNGDGNIVYVDCTAVPTGLIRIETNLAVGQNGRVCFKTTAAPGWLNVEIPGSFSFKAGKYDTYVKAVQGTSTTETTLEPEDWRHIGGGTGGWTTVEIRTSDTP